MNRRLLTFIIFAAISAGSATFVACSSDDAVTTPTNNNKKDSSKADSGDETDEDGGDETDEDGGTKPTDAGKKDTGVQNSECKNFPTPRDAAANQGVYCPFSVDGGPRSATDAAAGNFKNAQFCAPGQTCYLPAFDGFAECRSGEGAAIAGSVNWGCNADSDCSGGTKCCGLGTLGPTFNCSTQVKPSNFKGTKCQAACDSTKNEFKICDKNGGCESAQTCSPFASFGSTLGACH